MARVSCAELLAATDGSRDAVEAAVAALAEDDALVHTEVEPPWVARVARHRGSVARASLGAFTADLLSVPPLLLDEERRVLSELEVLRIRRRRLVLATPQGLRAALEGLSPSREHVGHPERFGAAMEVARDAASSSRWADGDTALSRLEIRPRFLEEVAAHLGAALSPQWSPVHMEVQRVEERLWAHELRLVLAVAAQLVGPKLAGRMDAVGAGSDALEEAVSWYGHRMGGRLSAFARPPVEAAIRGVVGS